MRTLCVALALTAMAAAAVASGEAAAAAGAAPAAASFFPIFNPLLGLAGAWTGNWGSTTGVYDPTHTLELTLDEAGAGAIVIQSGITGSVQCTYVAVPTGAPASWGSALSRTGGQYACTIRRTDGMVQGFTGDLLNAATEFSGNYLHYNVPGLITAMHLTKKPNPQPQPQRVLACENTAALLSCESARPDARIRVSDAMFGRDDTRTCPYSGGAQAMQNTACRCAGALAAVKSQCDGQRACAVAATNDRFGGDPCLGTFKYLRVTYVCA